MAIDFNLYLITDRKQTTRSLPEAVRLALQGGVRAIQLREKGLPVRGLLSLAQEIRKITREFNAKFFVNDRVDVAVAVEADGVHLGHESMPPEAVRRIVGKRLLIGVSTHNIKEAKAAETGGADFITFGPVFFTASKAPFGHPVGLDYLADAKKSVGIPLFGLGGIKTDNAARVLTYGADGVSMISEIFGSPDIEGAAQKVVSAISTPVR